MKKSEMILDFTSLLDVTMILLFFFIMSYNAQTSKLQQQAQDEIEGAREMSEAARQQIDDLEQERQEFEKERSELREQAQIELERLQGASSHTAHSLEAMRAFDKEQNIRIILDRDEDGWYIDIYSGDELLDTVKKGTDIYKAMKNAFGNAGYTKDDVLLIQFMYSSHMGWSKEARPVIEDTLDRLCIDYPYLYTATVDIDIVGKDK